MATVAFDSSTSAMRASHTNEMTSIADTLPSVNFGFEDLRERMARFSARFDEFIEKGRKRVLEERNQFRMSVAELEEDQRMRERDIEILDLKSKSHEQTIAKEVQETVEMHSAIETLTSQRDERLATRDTLRAQIAEVQKQIAARREAQQQHKRYVEGQARYNEPELNFWEDNLCLSIEGAGRPDRLKFVYTHICERDWEKEAWFELDTSERDYKIAEHRPRLDREEMDSVLDRVNETRDLTVLLKGMRELFVEAVK